MRKSSPLRPLWIFFAAIPLAAVFVCAGCNRAAKPAANSNQNNAQSAGASSPEPPGNPANLAQTAPAPNGSNQQSAPPPLPQKPSPITLTVPRGTMVPVRIDHELSTKSATAGESFTGTLYAPLQTPSGATAFPKGTSVTGTVIASKTKGRFKGAGILALRLRQIGAEPVKTEEFSISTNGKGKRSAEFIGGGAGGGAAIGAVAGGGKGALLGGLFGGGAGSVGAAFTGNKPIIIPAETKLRFRLTAPVTAVVPR